eukprot:15460512-Alexandrium_andersonii.AAC.1
MLVPIWTGESASEWPETHVNQCACHLNSIVPGNVVEDPIVQFYWLPGHLRSDAPFGAAPNVIQQGREH